MNTKAAARLSSRRFASLPSAPPALVLLVALAALLLSPGAAAGDSPAAFDLRPELTGQALFSCQAMGLSGSVVIDSRGSVGGAAQGEEGHLRSNAGITLSGNVQVWGDALAGPGAQVTKSGNATVHGQTGSAPSALACVPIALAPLETLLLAGNDNSRIPRTDRNKLALGGADGRTFTLSGNDGVTLPAGNYFFSSLSVSGNSTIRLEGRVNILVKGAISISGGGVVRQLGNVFQLRLWTRGTVAISSQARLQGFFYAPEGAIGISGGAHIEGTLFARSLTLSGNSTVRRSIDDGPPTLTLAAPLEGQSVAGCTVRVEGDARDSEENGLAVRVNGQPAALDANGHFALDLALGGADPSLVVVTATDGGGEVAQISRRVVLAPPAPTLTSPAPGALLGQRVVELAGGAGHATALTVDGIAATLAGGGWRIPSFDLGADGPKNLALVAHYCGGTVGETFALDLDTAPPLVAIDGPHSGDIFAGSPIDVTGTIAEAHLSRLEVGGIAAAVEGGRFTVTVPLTEGVQSLRAVAVDALGRATTSSPVSVELDGTAPEVSIDSPPTGAIQGESPVLVRGHSADANLEWVKVNGQTAALAGGQFSLSIALAEEENSLVAVARDRAGNSATSPAVVVVLDTLAPTVSIAAAELPPLTKEAEVTVIGSARDRNLDAVAVGGVAATLAGESFSAVVPLAEGANPLQATATDVLAASLAGHSASSQTVVVVRDSVPPSLAVAEPAAGELLGSRSVAVRGNAADPHLLRVTVGGEPATLAGETFESVRELGEGAQTIAVRAVDALDQASELNLEVVVDTLPPELSVERPLEGALVAGPTVSVAGRAADPHLESVTVNGLPAAFGEDGRWALDLELAGAAVTVVATDRLGHASETIISVVREARPPAIAFDPLPGAACSPGGVLAALGGTFDGDAAAPPSIVLEVRPPVGAPFFHPVAVDAAARRFSAANLDLGQADGVVTLVAKATAASGAVGQAIASVRVDAAPPRLQLTEGGAPFPAAGAGSAPPAGATPVLLGRQVAFGAIVADGDASTPPVPVFTLDGQPYSAGAPIAAAGNHLLVASAADCAGRAASVHAFFRLDRAAPQLLSTLPGAGAILEEGPAAFAGTSDPDLAAATVDGRPAVVSSGGAFRLAPYSWREGVNSVEIELVDAAGLRATYQRSFTVRAAALAVRIVESGLAIEPGRLFTRPVAPLILASTGEAAVQATLNGAPFVSGAAIGQSGEYLLVATASLGGRTASASATFRIDLSPGPSIAITAPADASEVAASTVQVRGTVGGESPTVTVDGRPALVQGGLFSLDGYPLPENEAATITAVAEDRLGRRASSQVTVLRRPSGPRVLILDPAEGTVTGRDRIDVAGAVADPPAELQSPMVTIHGGAGGPVAAPLAADGSFRARDVRLAAGANLLTAQALDRFGRTGSAAVTVHLDGQAPAIALTANGQPLEEGAVFGGAVQLTVAFSDGGGGLAARTIRLNGQLQAPPAGDVATFQLEDDGGYLLAVSVRDGAGNEARAERSFVLDRGGCHLSEIHPPAGSAVDAAAFTLAGRSGDATAVKVRVPAGAGVLELNAQLADGTFLIAGVPLPLVGENLLELVCSDAAGRPEDIPHPLRRLEPGQGPTIRILSPAGGAVLGSERTAVSGTLSGGAASVNGVAATVSGNGPGTFGLASLTLAEGPNVIAARAVDAGRAATDRIVAWRDTQAPRIVITSPDSGAALGIAGGGPARVDVSGRVELSDEPHLVAVRVSAGGDPVTATVDRVNGNFVALDVPLAAAVAGQAQTVTAVATDGLGHVGEARAELFLDPGGPAIVLSAPADLGRYTAASPAQIAVSGEVWAEPGAVVSVNGATVPDAALAWEAPVGGRRHASFSTQIALPPRDGSFGVVARVVSGGQRYAQARRLLIKDSVAPAVAEILPAAGSREVDPNSMALVLFSEAVDPTSLAAPDGLLLVRLATGESQAVTYAFAGNAVALVPAAALAAGERYEVRAGSAVRDLAGHPLAAPRAADFAVSADVLPAAPSLDPLPAVLCGSELTVSGQAAAGAAVKVKDGGLVFSANADGDGRFAVRLPLAANGWHYLSIYTVDESSGTAGPAAGHALRVDCSAPSVRDAVFDRATGVLTVFFSEAMDPASLQIGSEGDALRLRDAEDPASPHHPGVLLAGEPTAAHIQLDTAPEAWWRDRPLRLQVGAPARDERGNAMTAVFEQVFFPGSIGLAGGFLFGEAWDDTLGRPLAGARASLHAGAAGQGAPLAAADADGRGRYTFAGQVAAGRYAVLVEKAGFTPVVRRLALEPSRGAVPFDARLTPRAAALAEAVDPAAGGRRADAAGQALEAAAFALPGGEPLQVQLTALSGQGLPDFLPLGYTPAAAAEVRLLAAGEPLAEAPSFVLGNVMVELPLPSWVAAGEVLIAAQYEMATGRWLALQDPATVSAAGRPVARFAPLGPGTVAVLVRDRGILAPPPAPAFAALEGVEPPAEAPAFGAVLTLDPPVVSPTGRSLARLVAHSADGATPWPSGLAVQAFLEEELRLAAGQGKVLEAPFVADLLLYHPRLAEAEQDGHAEGSAGALTFVVSPSPRAAQVLLDVGYEKVRLYPFPEETERGQVVGPAGGTVGDPAEVELTVPEGALSSSTVAEVELLSAAELAQLEEIAGFRTLAAVRLDLKGRELARPATLRLPRPAAAAEEVAGDPRLIVAEQVGQPADQRAAFARLAARVTRQGTGAGQRLVASPEEEGGLPLDGIVREGLYLLLEAVQPIGFATGFVRAPGGVPLQFARVEAPTLGTADLSRLTGRYALPVAAGSARLLRALHPFTDEEAVGQVSLSAGQVVAADLLIAPVAPAIQSLQPADGATHQPTGSTVAVLFSEAIDPASAGSGTLALELVNAQGQPSGVFAAGRVAVSGSQVLFEATRPLPPGRTFVARFAGGVRDRQGTFYAGAVPVEWRFSTSTQVAPGGQVRPEKFHAQIPEHGVARIWAEPGALPLAQAGQPDWTVAPYLVGPFAGRDPLRPSRPARSDGSFEGTAGRPEYAATLASEVWVVVLDPTGQVAAEFEVGPLATADGRGFVAPPGEATTFRSAEGIVVDVPAAAFDAPTLVRLTLRPASSVGIATPRGLAIGAVVALDFAGEAKETLRLHVPAPAGAAAGAQVFVGEEKQMPWGVGLHFLSYGGLLERGGERFLSNDPSLQAEPDLSAAPGGSQVALRAGAGERTCQDVQAQNAGPCFAQDRLPEFVNRRLAIFYHEAGTDWSLIAGFAAPVAQGLGIGAEAILNGLESSWVFLPRLAGTAAGVFVLPAISSEPLTLERRDLATGWLLHSQAYSPLPAGDRDLVLYAPLAGDTLRRPMLVAAHPFEILRFAAPPASAGESLRLDIRAVSGADGQVALQSVPGLPVSPLTSLALFDVSALEASSPRFGAGPVAGPSRTVCGEEASWQLGPMAPSDRLLLVVGPGDFDTRGFEAFEFELDFPLEPVAGRDPDQIARLHDLGPVDGCKSASAPGYPRRLAVHLELELAGKRLRVVPESALAGGHRFELELVPAGLVGQGATPEQAAQLSYWPAAPSRFAFATRQVEGSPIGTLDPDRFPFGDSSSARDLLRFGNLLLAGSDSGRIVAIDTSEPAGEGKLKLHAISNATTTGVRTFATDGHERLFYTEIFGTSWAIKALRVEDAREAGASCRNQPDWARDVPCFDGVAGSVRIAALPGNALSAAQFLGAGGLPTGTPSDLELLVEDENGKSLDLEAFYETYVGSFAGRQPDADGAYTFDLPIRSTYRRFADGENEKSRPDDPTPDPRTRQQSCAAEESYDRYQRVTLDNLTTGQTWSIDVENPWPALGGAADGTATLAGVRARRNDRLRLRYNLKTLGYVSITGSGISVVDLNRFYRLDQPATSAGGTQCGRRLGRYEGADIEFPACAVTGSGPEGIRFTPALEVHSETGCASGQCRGTGRIDVYSPLMRVGGVHSKSSAEDPGYLQSGELAACISSVGGIFAQPVDAALANDVAWIDYGLRGDLAGSFTEGPAGKEPQEQRGDLLFLAIGNAGVFVFDVSQRQLGATLIGHFLVPNRNALRLQFDAARGILLIGGTDFSLPGQSRPAIDVVDVRHVNAAPGTRHLPASTATVFAPWTTRHLALDPSGTGLLHTWDPGKGPIALPIESPSFSFAGLYLAADAEPPAPGQRLAAVDRNTSMFVPLGVPMEVVPAAEQTERFENDKKSTAAFKLRLSLPGSFGEMLTARVQSLRALPEESLLGEAGVGEALALPGGPGWPDPEVTVRLRRVGSAAGSGAGGPLGGAFNLYESVETLLLIADPRASAGYRRQDAAGEADEQGQCRRCDWPRYLPDPAAANAGELAGVRQLLAGGRYLRAFLSPEAAAGEPARLATAAAIDFFRAQAGNYRLPAGWARVAAPADAVPSPFQAAQAEPVQNAATFSPGEMGVSVALAGGDLLFGATDHAVAGRGLPFRFDRSYRSLRLGYGPLGAGGWDAGLFAHLREIETTGEVEYHDGQGQVFRFYPSQGDDPGAGWERDAAGDAEGAAPGSEEALYRGSSYYVPAGLYLRLQKLANREGWRLVGRDKSVAEFDPAGRLRLLSDRIRQAKPVGEQGNSLELRYDAFGKLVEVVDDLGRRHRFEYFEDPQADGERYGLLKSLRDFAGREVLYQYDDARRLEEVQLPEVRNPIGDYAQHSYAGEARPRIAYRYAGNGAEAPAAPSAVAHGELAEQRLVAVHLPEFGGFGAPRVRFTYDAATGRVKTIAFPTPENQNADGGSVAWQLSYSATAAPAAEATVTAPWGHPTTYLLEKGRTREVRQQLEVRDAAGEAAQQAVATAFTYRPDGRLESVAYPDGGEDRLLYADSLLAGVKLDRLSLPNVEKATRRAPEGGRGTAVYSEITTEAFYRDDNQVSLIVDGLARPTQVALPLANKPTATVYEAEGVRQGQQIDAYGRAREQVGGAELQKTVLAFGKDAKDKESAGLVKRIAVGQMSTTFERDAAGNVERAETAQQTSADALYDEWDRAIRSTSGLSSGELAPVGGSGCAEGPGARSERAFDAAGHLIRERSLQDFVGEEGQLGCRWVETRYTYNAREQVVEVRQTQLSDPGQPGAVSPAERLVAQAVFDAFGRPVESRALNQADGAVATHYRYDAAGRSVGVKVGETAEQVQGFDAKNRVVYRSDGDRAVWQGRYDAWDRLWLERQPTGAYVQHFYDRANNPTQQTVWSRDPAAGEGGEGLLKDTRTTFTSFGEVQRVVEVLTAGAERQVRVTERDFDSAGRVTLVASGPAGVGDQLDRGQARREKQIAYEPETGRVLAESSGGLLSESPLFEQRYDYEPALPWPYRVRFFEKVPGLSQPTETQSASYRRDALGRVVEEKRSDGSKVATVYDRLTGQPIQVTTGAGATSTVSYDGAGRQVRATRPNDRGETLYAYDLDGRLRQQVTRTDSTDWATTYGYDAVGRQVRVDYQDGSFATTTWNSDSTVAEQRTRDGLTLSYTYDAANRPLSVVPSGTVAPTLEPLDGGDETTWDALSRPTSQRRGDPSLTVSYPSYDLGSRPAEEKVGSREALGWAWDIYNQPIETRLPLGVGRGGGAFTGFRRHFDSLDQMTSISALGGEPQTVALGANWSWGGAGRLWGMTTKGSLGTSVRYGYLGGAGAQPPAGNPGAAKWRLGTMTWGAMPGADPVSTATQTPSQIWGQFGFGYRGSEGDPRDGAKVGRLAVTGGRDLFAGAGWSWDYDAGVRLAEATPGRGSLSGTPESEAPPFRYQYGKADELQQIVDEASGQVAGIESGAYGRITSRNGIPFTYDAAGRRTEDDRFHYKWSWRGELVEVTVKTAWPEGQESDFAGHQVRYRYDAQGRLTTRSHFTPPESGGERRLLEKRAYVWEGQSLLVEAAYTDEAETQLQWRKTYIPGPSGLDDAIQVKVENFAGPGIAGTRLYTYIRDELGTVIGIVGEEENNDPANPAIPVRYLYSPYGEAHIEKGLETRRVRFEEAEDHLGNQSQTIAYPNQQSRGTLIVTFAAALDLSSLPGGLVVERYSGAEWVLVQAQDLIIGSEDSLELRVLVKEGWARGASYRIRLTGVKDQQGKGLAKAETFNWDIGAGGTSSDFSKKFGVQYETAKAAIDTLGGRFPGGQNSLFQGLWVDPVTGIAYARARWYDGRNTGWLSEDPLLDVDSFNLYAFVGWQPQSASDPMGLEKKPEELSVGRQLEIIDLRYRLQLSREKTLQEASTSRVIWKWIKGEASDFFSVDDAIESAKAARIAFNKTGDQISAHSGDRFVYADEFADQLILPARPGLEAAAPLGQTSRNIVELGENAAKTTYYAIDSVGQAKLAEGALGAAAAGIFRMLRTRGIEDQLDFLVANIPGLDRRQARLLLEESFSRGSSVVFGGSRVRGDFRIDSDLDVGFGSLSASQAAKVLKKGQKAAGLALESTIIVPGNKTHSIEEIISPEEFFQRSGIRAFSDSRAGQPYFPSGSITVTPGGGVIAIPAGGLN